MTKRFITFLRRLAIKIRYAAGDTADEHERGSLNAIATVLEMVTGYRKLPTAVEPT